MHLLLIYVVTLVKKFRYVSRGQNNLPIWYVPPSGEDNNAVPKCIARNQRFLYDRLIGSKSIMAAQRAITRCTSRNLQNNNLLYIHCVEDVVTVPMKNFPIMNLQLRLVHFNFPARSLVPRPTLNYRNLQVSEVNTILELHPAVKICQNHVQATSPVHGLYKMDYKILCRPCQSPLSNFCHKSHTIVHTYPR